MYYVLLDYKKKTKLAALGCHSPVCTYNIHTYIHTIDSSLFFFKLFYYFVKYYFILYSFISLFPCFCYFFVFLFSILTSIAFYILILVLIRWNFVLFAVSLSITLLNFFLFDLLQNSKKHFENNNFFSCFLRLKNFIFIFIYIFIFISLRYKSL